MPASLRHPATVLWLLLVGATLLSWYWGGHRSADEATATVGVVLIALFKIRLIIRHFMEIQYAPSLWRIVFDAWLGAVGAAMIGLYLALR